MTKHSSQTKSRELPFFDLIDKKISFDFLLGIFVCAFKREKWNENIKVANLNLMKDVSPGQILKTHVFLLKYFVGIF